MIRWVKCERLKQKLSPAMNIKSCYHRVHGCLTTQKINVKSCLFVIIQSLKNGFRDQWVVCRTANHETGFCFHRWTIAITRIIATDAILDGKVSLSCPMHAHKETIHFEPKGDDENKGKCLWVMSRWLLSVPTVHGRNKEAMNSDLTQHKDNPNPGKWKI